jgi:Tol biopolymer transport system component/DNA-binding winged helix-turn-helix (wHTH) protein
MAGSHFHEFGAFRLDPTRRLLLRRGEAIPLTSKVLDTLLVLVENRGRAVTKEELMKALWPDTFVEENNLTQNISTLRKVLGESPNDHSYIETIPKLGYRFVATVVDGSASPSPDRRRALWIAAGVLPALAIAASTLLFFGQRIKTPAPSLMPVPLTAYPGDEWQPSFSPDGNQVAFAWNGKNQDNFDIYAKLIGTDQPLRLTMDPAEDLYPAWSPDGRLIAFARSIRPAASLAPPYPRKRADRHGIFLIPAIGGPERKLAETDAPLPAGFPRRLLSWSPDNKWLVTSDRSVREEPAGLFLLSVATGEKRRLTRPPARTIGDVEPVFSPDGRTLVFRRVLTLGVSDLCLLPLTAELAPKGEPRRLTAGNQLALSPTWTWDGREVIFASGQELSGGLSLWRTPVSGSAAPRRLEFAGNRNDFPAVSPQGRLAYTSISWDQNIWSLDLSGRGVKTGAPQRFIASTGINGSPQFSPDGRRISFLSNRSGYKELWICDRDGSNSMQLTSMRAPIIGSPRWSPDGERIIFDSNREGQYELYVISSSGGVPQRLTTHRANDAVGRWSRDGRSIYFVSDRSGQGQVWKMPWPPSGREAEAVQVTRNGGYMAVESPDGRFLYFSKPGTMPSLWRIPLQGGEEARVLESVMLAYFAVTQEGIYFCPSPERERRRSIQFLSFATDRASPVLELSGWPDGGLSVSPDGRRLLYAQIDQQGSDLMLVEDFR